MFIQTELKWRVTAAIFRIDVINARTRFEYQISLKGRRLCCPPLKSI